jgi:hypothetical protein
MKTVYALLLVFVTFAVSVQAQTGISAAGTAPDASAMLDVIATDKGLLVPRVALVATNNSLLPIPSPADGLLVYNTGLGGVATKGFYYWDATNSLWQKVITGNGTFPTGSGTLNYITKWTPSGTQLGNSSLFDNGKVGLGTITPPTLFSIASAEADFTTGMSFGRTATSNGKYVLTNSDNQIFRIAFAANGGTTHADYVNRMVIDATGNVGIGTTLPNAQLDVRTTTAANFPVLRVNNDAVSGETGIRFRTQSSGGLNAHSDISWTATGTETGNLVFRVPYTNERMRIQSNGNVGIGTTAPGRILELYGTAPGIKINDPNASGNSFVELNTVDGGLSYFQNIGGRTRIHVGGAERMTFLNGGNVGINSATPGQKLDVAGNIKLDDNMMVEGNSVYRVYRNLATYNSSSNAAAGAFVINTTQAWNSQCMFRLKVEGYFYDATAPFETTIGGYMYSGNDFYNYGYVNVGAKNLTVRFARNTSTNTVAIILGDEATSYSYPKLTVTSYMQGHNTTNEAYADGWTMAQITSLTGYDFVVSVPNVTSLPSGSGNYIQNQIAGAQTTSNFWISNTGRAAAFQLNNANTSLTEGNGDALRMTTTTGYIDIGSQNTSWAHIETDRPRYYFNKGVTVDEGFIGSYNEDLSLQTSGTTRITALNSNGNVGIGTTVPAAKLHIVSTTNEDGIIIDAPTYPEVVFRKAGSTAGYLAIAGNAGGYATGSLTNSLILRSESAYSHMTTGGSNIVLTANGTNIGIGTTAPAAKLEVVGTSARVSNSGDAKFEYFGSGSDRGFVGWQASSPAGVHLLNRDNSPIYFGTTNTERMRIDAGGNVGIGTITTSTGKLTVSGEVLRTNTRIDNAEKYPVSHSSNGNNLFTIDPTWTNAELQTYFNSTNVQWIADATAPAGYAIQITGAVNVGGEYNSGFPYIPVETGVDYYMECWIRSSSGTDRHYMGSNEYNESFTSLGGNPGSYGYWVMSNTLTPTGWTKVSGYIRGFDASATGKFELGTKYWTPMALFNYGTNGTSYISGWKVTKLPGAGATTSDLRRDWRPYGTPTYVWDGSTGACATATASMSIRGAASYSTVDYCTGTGWNYKRMMRLQSMTTEAQTNSTPPTNGIYLTLPATAGVHNNLLLSFIDGDRWSAASVWVCNTAGTTCTKLARQVNNANGASDPATYILGPYNNPKETNMHAWLDFPITASQVSTYISGGNLKFLLTSSVNNGEGGQLWFSGMAVVPNPNGLVQTPALSLHWGLNGNVTSEIDWYGTWNNDGMVYVNGGGVTKTVYVKIMDPTKDVLMTFHEHDGGWAGASPSITIGTDGTIFRPSRGIMGMSTMMYHNKSYMASQSIVIPASIVAAQVTSTNSGVGNVLRVNITNYGNNRFYVRGIDTEIY